MKLIYRIAKAELRMLFCSPVAWFLLVIFTLQTALFFTGRYEWFMKGNEYGSGRTMMTSMALFANGIWGIVQNYLYYYIPLLTMGLISRELSSGSIKLLYSSPIRNSQIILGKFLSMVMYAAIMCGILLLYVVYAAFTVENFELPVVLVGFVGLVSIDLYICGSWAFRVQFDFLPVRGSNRDVYYPDAVEHGRRLVARI